MALNCRLTGPVGEIGKPSTQHVMEMLSKDAKDVVCYHQLVIGECSYEARGGNKPVLMLYRPRRQRRQLLRRRLTPWRKCSRQSWRS